MRILEKVVLTIVVIFVCAQVVCAADPLSVWVNCQGCSARDGNNFYASAGETITFTVSSTGGIGSKSYKWTKDGTLVHNSIEPFPIIVKERTEYILTVTDSRGYVRKTVKISPVSQEKSKCLPSFRSEIIIYDERDREEYSIGDCFILRVRLDTRDCPDSDYKFYWIADDPNVIFVNPNSTKTEVRIGQGAKNGKVEIEAIITNGKVVRRPKNGGIEIEIVRNTPPQFEIEHDEIICSYTRFNVWPSEFEPGERGESGDFLCSCSAILKNEKGKIVDSASKIASHGKISSLRLKPRGIGIYFIEMTVEDSHGAFAVVSKTIQVVKGDTGKDVPIVRAPDVVYCIIGEICKIDTSETLNRDKTVSNFGFYNDKTNERLANSRGDYCSGPVCKCIFTYPGTYKIRIEANYFDEDLDDYRESEIGSKIVTVIVNSDEVILTPTATVVFTPKPVTPTPARTNIAEELEKKEGIEKILSDISNIIDKIKNILS